MIICADCMGYKGINPGPFCSSFYSQLLIMRKGDQKYGC